MANDQTIYCVDLQNLIEICVALTKAGLTFKAYVMDLRVELTGGY